MAAMEEVSLRPMALRPGGKAANPFAAFGRGAGAGLVTKVAEPGPLKEVVRKRPEDIVRYARDFLMTFNDTHLSKPEGLTGPAELLVEADGAVPTASVDKAALTSLADDRNWRGRAAAPAAAPEGQAGGASGRRAAGAATPAAGASGSSSQEGPAQQQRPTPNGVRAEEAAGAPGSAGNAPIAMERAQDVGKQAWQPRAAAAAGASSSATDSQERVGVLASTASLETSLSVLTLSQPPDEALFRPAKEGLVLPLESPG